MLIYVLNRILSVFMGHMNCLRKNSQLNAPRKRCMKICYSFREHQQNGNQCLSFSSGVTFENFHERLGNIKTLVLYIRYEINIYLLYVNSVYFPLSCERIEMMLDTMCSIVSRFREHRAKPPHLLDSYDQSLHTFEK